MISEERKAELHQCWNMESEEEHTHEWREDMDLTEEEQQLINRWDREWNDQILHVLQKIAGSSHKSEVV